MQLPKALLGTTSKPNHFGPSPSEFVPSNSLPTGPHLAIITKKEVCDRFFVAYAKRGWALWERDKVLKY